MPKRVLVPTDFSIDSLNVLKEFLQKDNSSETYDVVLTCGYQLSDSISDLLFFSKYKILRAMNTEAFMDALSILQNKFSTKISATTVDLFTGDQQSTFEDYLQGMSIEQLVFVENATFKKTFKKTFALNKFIAKSKAQKVALTYKIRPTETQANEALSVLFNTASSFS